MSRASIPVTKTTSPLILTIGTRWRSVVTFALRPLHPQCPLNRSLLAHHSRFGSFGEKKGNIQTGSGPHPNSNLMGTPAFSHRQHTGRSQNPTSHLQQELQVRFPPCLQVMHKGDFTFHFLLLLPPLSFLFLCGT